MVSPEPLHPRRPDVSEKINLLISQWQGHATDRLTQELLTLIDEELVQPLAALEQQSNLGTARGAGLDWFGERLGFARPVITVSGTGDLFDFAPPVYAVGRDSNLYTISISDRAGGAGDLPSFDASLSLVGGIGWMPVAIAWANGNLYAIQTNGDIHALDTATGAASATAIRRLSGTTIAATAVRDDVIWYYSGPTPPSNAAPSLRTYDPATNTEDDSAVATLTGMTGGQDVTAMAWWDGTLYLFGMNSRMYSVDTETGVCTPLLDGNGNSVLGTRSVNAATVLPVGLADPDAEAAASAIYTSDPSGNIGRITLNPFNYQPIASVRSTPFAIASMARSGPEGAGFDQARFATTLPSLIGTVGIGDEWYRAMLRARARMLVGVGNIVDVRDAARLLFDGGAVVNDGDRYNVWAVVGGGSDLYSIAIGDASASASRIGSLGIAPQALAWHEGALYASIGAGTPALYTVDPATADTTEGEAMPTRFRGMASFGGQLWGVTSGPNRLYLIDPGSGATPVGDFTGVGGTCESVVAHDGVLYMFTRNPNRMYAVNTADASTTDVGDPGDDARGSASVGPYIYMLDTDGNLRRTQPTASPFATTPFGSIGHNQVRAMASQFVPTIQYTDSRGEAYGDIAEQHAAALLGLPAGVANSVWRA